MTSRDRLGRRRPTRAGESRGSGSKTRGITRGAAWHGARNGKGGVRLVHWILAVAALVAATGCCVGGAGACVVGVGAAERCAPSAEEIVCWYDTADTPPLPTLSSCGGRFHGGEDCPDLGFKKACDGGYYVRPWTPC